MSWNSHWPDLPLDAWSETCDTLQLWTQVAGKVRIACTPLVNHWWNSTFRVNARGLVAPQNRCGERTFDIVFDLVDVANWTPHPSRNLPESAPDTLTSVLAWYRSHGEKGDHDGQPPR